MKYNVNGISEIEVLSTSEEKEITLSADSKSLIFQMFSKNIYSNPIGSIVREITSNCFDSHIEANVNAPVVIRKHKDNQTDTNYISFIDYGVGMSPDRINNIFSVMFSSTKRDNNKEIGCFGLGSKVPLSYKRSTGYGLGEYDNSYYITTIFNGIKYVYQIYEKNNIPMYSELHNEPTTERNGTEIQIPVLQKDMDKFESEMVRQLYYFENVVFEGFYKTDYNGRIIEDEHGNPVPSLRNDYQIIRGKSFLFRGSEYSNSMHVCLGRVAYPIDYNVLDLSSSDYRLPIALKLEVGDINVIVSREQLDYNEKTIKLLKTKLEEAKQEIGDRIAKQYQNIETLEDYFQVKNDFGQLEFQNGTSLYVGDLIKQSDIDFSNFKYQFMKMPNDKQLFKFFFSTKTMGKKPSKSRYNSTSDAFTGSYNALKSNTNVYFVEDEWKRKVVKQAWLKETHGTWYLITPRKIDNRVMRHEIADLFNVALDDVVDDQGKPVRFIQSLLDMQNEYLSIVQREAQNYDTLEIPEDFIESRKRETGITEELRKKTIPVNFIGGNSRERVKLDNLFKYRMPIVYGTTDDEYELNHAKQLFNLLFYNKANVNCEGHNGEFRTRAQRQYDNDNKDEPKQSIMFIRLAKNNVKYMEYCRNAYHVSEFKTRMLRRKTDVVRQFFATSELVEKFKELDNFYRNGFINVISDKWGKKIEAVRQYIDTIPKEARNDHIRYYKHMVQKYFKLDDIKPDAKQKKVLKIIEDVQKLEAQNSKIMKYFNMPYSVDELEKAEELVTILQVSLAL
jgi:hypothetical protein